MVGLISVVPQLIWLSQYKIWVFSASALLLAISSYLQYQARFEPCPTDPKLAQTCMRSRVWSKRILFFSTFIWVLGAFFAFLAPRIL